MRLSINLISLGIACFLINISSLAAVAKSKANAVRAPFLAENPSVAQAALGGEQIAATESVATVFSNPAALTTLQRPQLMIGHSDSFFDLSRQALAYGSAGSRNAWAASGQFNSVDSQKRVQLDAQNNLVQGLGDFQPFSSVVQLSWARKLGLRNSLGLTAKGWWENLDNTSEKSWATDIGILTQPLSSQLLRVGATIKNLGPSVDGFDIPLSYALGASFQFKTGWLQPVRFYSEYDKADYSDPMVRLGLEFKQKFISLRAGYFDAADGTSQQEGRPSLGAGFHLGRLDLDYAWVDSDRLGEQHRFSLSYGFGLTPDEKRAQKEQLDTEVNKRMAARAHSHTTKGDQAMKLKNWDEAVNEYIKAALWNPKDSKIQKRLVRAKIKQKQAQKSRKKHKFRRKTVKKEKPVSFQSQQKKFIESLIQNAYTFYTLGNYEEALTTWKKVIALDPENKDAKWALKEMTAKIPDSSSADNAKRQIKELNAKAFQHYGSGELKQALNVWKHALELDPRNKMIEKNIQRVQNELAIVELK